MATIPEYYRDKIIFVTGATGFIGKVLVEKLLRSCPQLQAIYCLTRSKQGEAASDRLSRMLSEPVGFVFAVVIRYCVNLSLHHIVYGMWKICKFVLRMYCVIVYVSLCDLHQMSPLCPYISEDIGCVLFQNLTYQ